MRAIQMFLLISVLCWAIPDKSYETIMSLIKNKKLDDASKKIDDLYNNNSSDPDVYVLLINYKLAKSINDHVYMESGKPDSSGEYFLINDKEIGK